MRAEEYRAWQALTPAARLDAATELSIALYWGKETPQDLPARLQSTSVRLQQPQR
jgi:hypothetical protein